MAFYDLLVASGYYANPTTGFALLYFNSTDGKPHIVNSGGTDTVLGGLSTALPSANIFVGNSGGTATPVTMIGDVTISNTGSATVGSLGGKVVSLAGSFTMSGAFATTITTTGATSVTLPTTGTLLATTGNGSALTGITWSQIGSTPTTLAGYGIASPLPAAQGGTGQTSVLASFQSLFESVATTQGDILYGGASGAPTRLAGVTATAVGFLSDAGNGTTANAPTWVSSTGSGSVVLASSPTIATLSVTGAFTATGLVTNADLANSSVTLGSTGLALGSTVTTVAGLASITSVSVTASTTLALSGASTTGSWTIGAATTVTNAGTLSGGTLAGTVTNAGTLLGGILAGTVINSGTLIGGTLAGAITGTGTLTGETISGGALTGTIAGSPTLTGSPVFNTGTPSFNGVTGLYNGAKGSVGIVGGSTGAAVIQELYGISAAGAVVRLTADGAAAGATNVINLPTATLASLSLTVAARNTINGDGATWSTTVLYCNQGGTLVVGNPGTTAIAPDYFISGNGVSLSTMAGATMTVSPDATNLGINVTIAPNAGNTTAVLHCSGALWGNQVT